MTDELPEETTPEPTQPQPPGPSPALPPEPAARAPGGPKRPLPGTVTAAAIVLLVFGTLAAFGSSVALLWSLFAMRRLVPVFNDEFGPGLMGGFHGGQGSWMGIASFGLTVVIGAAVAGGHLAAGWAVLKGMAWGRILGMVVSGVGLVVLVLGVSGTLIWASALQSLPGYMDPGFMGSGHMVGWFRSMMTSSVAFGVVVSIAAGIAYVFVLTVLARHGEAFD